MGQSFTKSQAKIRNIHTEIHPAETPEVQFKRKKRRREKKKGRRRKKEGGRRSKEEEKEMMMIKLLAEKVTPKLH